MPKPIKVRDTSNPLGQKINRVMAEKGMAGDYKQLAAEFGVTPPSVYDWVDHARLGKERFRQLVQWSGRSLDWWFDTEDLVSATTGPAHPLPAMIDQTPYLGGRPVGLWPFSRSLSDFLSLAPEDRARVDGYITALVDSTRTTATKHKASNGG